MADATNAVAINIWTARIIPPLLAGIIGYATYVVVGPLSVDYLLTKRKDTAAAVAILVIYFLLLTIMGASFLRLAYITYFEPPYVRFGPAAIRDRARSRQNKTKPIPLQDIGSGEYNSGNVDVDPDSPGLEMFYTKDVFVSEMDGKPKWCTHCGNWKPDRAHHCSSSARCIQKMDHFCPWVGGPIGENNFKFFIQFTGWTAVYCLHILVVTAYYIHQQRTTPGERLNPQFAVLLGLSAFYGLFTGGMTATSGELAIRNQTLVERLGAETRVHILAVIKPSAGPVLPVDDPAATVPLYQEITYPLDTGSSYRDGLPQGTPQTKSLSHTRQADQPPAPAILTEQTSSSDNAVASSDTPGTQDLSPTNALGQQHTEESYPPSRDLSDRSTIVAAPGSSQTAADAPIPETHWPRKEVAERDLRATRTFNILKMLEPGYNPWDLGSSRLNWESVMGLSVLDWFLPLRRSPCCSHDGDESYYELGPMVDLLRSKYNLLPESEIRAYGGRRRTERRDPAEILEAGSQNENEYGEGLKKRKKRRHHSEKGDDSATGQSTDMTGRQELK